VVVEPDPRTMQQSKGLLDELKRIGIPAEKTSVVMVHRVRTEQAMSASDVQKAIGAKVEAVFTPAPELAYQAARVTDAMVLVEPDSFTAQQTSKYVNLLLQPAEKN
jgi:hypothetical protein